MEFRPIFSAMMRNKVGVLLIALQIALTLAIVSNAFHIIQERRADVSRPSGMDEENTFSATTEVFVQNADLHGMVRQDLDAIRAIPGVIAASPIQAVPVSGSGWGEDFYITPDQPSNETISFGNFMTDEYGVEALGINLVQGRNFTQQDIMWQQEDSEDFPPVVLISQALADALYPDGDALGKIVYDNPGSNGTRIIGIYEKMQNSWPSSTFTEQSAIMPRISDSNRLRYMVRTEPGQKDTVMAAVENYLGEFRGRIVLNVRDTETTKARYYSRDVAMVKLLTAVVVLLAAITSLGIVGLAWFSVSQRQKQIGTRRALGARKLDILRYFMVENLLITSIGLAIGVALALGLNYFLDTTFQTGRMNLIFIPIGMLLLWALGLLAVLAPARRAAAIPPAIATRNV